MHVRACYGFVGVLLMVSGSCAHEPTAAGAEEWQRYVNGFVAPDGRVVDTGNAAISHSEGQGIGMLLATAFDDKSTFSLIWSWTQAHLQVRADQLLAWRWDPNGVPPVGDDNNASDGDMLVAWALLRASRQWGEVHYRESALRILADLRTQLVRKTDRGRVILPGARGFEHDEAITINLSYWVFPALMEFGRVDPGGDWDGLAATGIALLKTAGHGRWGLPPDWLVIDQTAHLAAVKPPRFGYDAVRIPLYLAWTGHREALEPFVSFWDDFKYSRDTPAWMDLETNLSSQVGASVGQHAVIQLARRAIGREAAMPPSAMRWHRGDHYYPVSLLMLARLAQDEMGQ